MAASVEIEAPQEFRDLFARLSQAEELASSEKAAQKVAPELTRILVERSGEVAGFGPSRFSAGWLAQPEGPNLRIVNTSPLARVIEFPTVAHIIEARPGKVLAWVPGRGAFSAVNASKAKASAGWVFAKRVHHPGTPGKNVFQKTMESDGGKLVFAAMTAEATYFLLGK